MREIYHLSDIVVSASKKPESFGRSAAEALAMNTTVIATNHGGITDIVIEGKTGFLVPVSDEDKMSKAIINASKIEWIGLREFVEQNFTLELMSSKTLQTYEALLQQRL
jgi:glycosyltransferase involved in cell wall biosynthesis